MSEEWGPWIEHDGKGLPVRAGTIVHVLHADGTEEVVVAGLFLGGPPELVGSSWHHGTGWLEVVRYRIRKPRGLTILEEVAKGIREPVDA